MLPGAKMAHETALAPSGAAIAATVSLFACACGTHGLILWESPNDAGLPPNDASFSVPDAGMLDAGAKADSGPRPIIVLSDAGQTQTNVHGGPYGKAFSESCAANQVIIGYEGQTWVYPDAGLTYVSALRGLCGTVSVGGPAS